MAAIYLDFAGRKRKFELRIGEIGELERVCLAGIGEINMRLLTERWRYDDIRETIRLGLMGGGASEMDAQMLIETYVDANPLRRHVGMAADILHALIEGADAPKAQGETDASGAPATSPPSTKPAAPSDLTLEPSTA
jgi:hypothetical protein